MSLTFYDVWLSLCNYVVIHHTQFLWEFESMQRWETIRHRSHIDPLTALSDFLTLKVPARSGDWEFVNTSPTGSSFKVIYTANGEKSMYKS